MISQLLRGYLKKSDLSKINTLIVLATFSLNQLKNMLRHLKIGMLIRVVNFSKSPNWWLHNVLTLWYHIDNHALSHITDSTNSSWLNMTWHLFLYAAISYSNAQTGAKCGTMCPCFSTPRSSAQTPPKKMHVCRGAAVLQRETVAYLCCAA